MRSRALGVAAALAVLALGASCDLFNIPDEWTDSSLAECKGGPVHIAIPATVFCGVSKITATVSGIDMATINVTIDQANPSTTLTIPSGPDRRLMVWVYTADHPDTPAFVSPVFSFCVPDRQPVTVAVDVVEKNRNPDIRGIDPGSGTFPSGEAVRLTASASDPDACDRVKSFSWSTDSGTIAAEAAKAAVGSAAIWTPQCPGPQACDASVTVRVADLRGGSGEVRARFRVTPKPAVIINTLPDTAIPN
jgi:hypothetical protein